MDKKELKAWIEELKKVSLNEVLTKTKKERVRYLNYVYGEMQKSESYYNSVITRNNTCYLSDFCMKYLKEFALNDKEIFSIESWNESLFRYINNYPSLLELEDLEYSYDEIIKEYLIGTFELFRGYANELFSKDIPDDILNRAEQSTLYTHITSQYQRFYSFLWTKVVQYNFANSEPFKTKEKDFNKYCLVGSLIASGELTQVTGTNSYFLYKNESYPSANKVAKVIQEEYNVSYSMKHYIGDSFGVGSKTIYIRKRMTEIITYCNAKGIEPTKEFMDKYKIIQN
jgi:hypothetical protein